MNKKVFWGLIASILIFSTLAATRSAWMDTNDLTFLRTYIKKINILPQEKNLAYEQNCSACHMLYAPGILPARSWQKIMVGLDQHFGDNAEVSSAVQQDIQAYLQRNAADKVENIYAQPMLELLPDNQTPMRASETRYFKLLHDVVHDEMVIGNPQVTSFARCDACHREAIQGRFNKFNVRIPNFRLEGTWIKAATEPKPL